MNQGQDTTVAARPASEVSERGKTFKIPISNGIFDHYGRLKDALWLFLWYIDKTTKEKDDGKGNILGSVLGGSPRRDSDVAISFGVDKRTVCRWRNCLAKHGYIKQRITPFGAVVQVVKSKKWITAKRDKNVPPQGDAPSNPETRSAQCRTKTSQGGTQTALAKKTLQYSSGTEQKERTPSSVSDLGTKIRTAYQQASVSPTWRRAEANGLEQLAAKNDPRWILAAIRSYLQHDDEWLRQNGWPFGYFVKKFSDYRAIAVDELKAEFQSACIDWVEEQIRSESVMIRYISGKRKGDLDRVGTQTAEDLVKREIAEYVGDKCPTPPNLIDVFLDGRAYRIEKSKAARYLQAGIITEQRLKAC